MRSEIEQEIANPNLSPLRLAANQFNEVIGKHERDVHGGQPCLAERANAIAYIAHTIGLNLFSQQAYEMALSVYEMYQTNCPHGEFVLTNPTPGAHKEKV